jgi:hypothetical protein
MVGGFFQGKKHLSFEADHPPPFNAEAQNVLNQTSTLSV